MPTTTSPESCVPQLLLDDADITAGQVVSAHVVARPGDHVHIEAYTRPSTTYAVIRADQVVPATGVLDYTFRPSGNTRMFAASAECDSSPSEVVMVHGALSIAARRDAARTYTFSAAVFPAAPYEGQVVRLYYLNGTTPVLKASGRIQSGRARVTVHFARNAKLSFFLAAPANPTNVAARSKNRPTVIY